MKCLEKDRTRRYESGAQLAADIGRHVKHEPVFARPPTAIYRAQKYFRRNRVPALASAAVAMGILLGIFLTSSLRRDQDKTTGVSKNISANTEARPTENLEAYNLYLKGKFFFSKWTQETIAQGSNYLAQAIALDPNFALAHAAMAELQIIGLYYGGKPKEILPVIRLSAERALRLQPNLPDAHYVMGLVNLHQRNWNVAETNLNEALALDSKHALAHDWKGWLLAALGRPIEGLEEMRAAHRLDPLSAITNPDLAFLLMFADKTDEAMEQCRETLRMDPLNYQALELLGRLNVHKQNYPEARRYYEMAGQQNKGPDFPHMVEAILAAAMGRREECLRFLKLLEQDYNAGQAGAGTIAGIYGRLGDLDSAFAWEEKAFEDYDPNLIWIQVQPEAKSLRQDPRYSALLQRMGLARR